MNIKHLPFAFAFFLFSCQSDDQKTTVSGKQEKKSFDLFNPIPPDFTTTTVLIPEGFEYEILFSEKTDSVVKANGSKFPAKGLHDFTAFLPIKNSSEHGYLYVNHETSRHDENLGDGGGGTFFEVIKKDGKWETVGDFKHIDFSPVGGTLRNCGGTVTPYNTILTAEETEPKNNKELWKAFRDTSDFNGMKRYQHFGWMVEVDPFNGKAIRKLYQMGRFQHEDAHITPDGKTVYLTDDNNPAVFFKFVSIAPVDYSSGQLYAYRQSDDGESGEWLELPMEMDSLIDIRNVAMRRGATLFIRHEWVDGVDGKVYITETGGDSFDWNPYVAMGAKPANYFDNLKTGEHQYADPYGRVLVFDEQTNKMSVLLEGGTSATDPSTNFANPDGLCILSKNGSHYLVINEDLIGLDKNRVSEAALSKKETYNEIYFLDLSIQQPLLDDLKRFMVGPRGCETTGGWFTPDGNTYFVSIQHPSQSNPEPFNLTSVIAVRFP